jgi:16S rRNA (uracil1498-N3)-methyltransferase
MVPRLYVTQALTEGARIDLEASQAHYLRNVLRLAVGGGVRLFNGRDGEWETILAEIGRRSTALEVGKRLRAQHEEPDVWLCFAPVKRARLDFLVEKASELGVARLVPVFTARTVVERVNLDRLRANAVEACEQSERLTVPQIADPVDLAQLLAGWPGGRRIMVCDETGGGTPIAAALAALDEAARVAPWSILIGPEGGFTRAELDRVGAMPGVTAVGLGPRILRADTAALAALALWQALLGDWRRQTPRRWPDYATGTADRDSAD